MRFLTALLLMVPAYAGSIVNGGSLLSQANADQLATWFGQGDLTFTNVTSIAGNTANGSTIFHSAVDGIGPTFILISTHLGLLGGYNPASWRSDATYTLNPTAAGRTAFVFNLTTLTLHNQRMDFNGQFQTFNFANYGPAFGGGHDVAVTTSNLSSGHTVSFTYGPGLNGTNLLGGSQLTPFSVNRVEAFTFTQGPEVPEPTTVTFVGSALAGVVLLKRRYKNN